MERRTGGSLGTTETATPHPLPGAASSGGERSGDDAVAVVKEGGGGLPPPPLLPRTARPSDWQHAMILMKRNLRADVNQKRLWFARTFIACFMLFLWTIGFFFGYPDPNEGGGEAAAAAAAAASGGYVIHPAESWEVPVRIVLGGADDVDLSAVADGLGAWGVPTVRVVDETNNSSDFRTLCKPLLEGSEEDAVGIFLDGNLSYGLHYKETGYGPYPFRPVLAGAQRAVNSALLNATGVKHLDVDSLQKVPEKVAEEDQGSLIGPAPVVNLIVPGILLSLSVAIMMMFLIGPMVNEKLQGVTQSFILVGVKRHVYVLHWAAYHSVMGLFTAGGLTALSIGWKLYPMSNAGLIFVSHLLAVVQTSLVSSLVSQLVNQEELASGLPWIFAFGSMAVSAPFLILDAAKWALSVFTVLSPFVGMITYSAVYVNYDIWGYAVGVHPGLNVASSGLLAVTVAQVAGIIFWICAIVAFCAPRRRRRAKRDGNNCSDGASASLSAGLDGDSFEPLPSDVEVVVSIRDLSRSFISGCIKKSEPVEVLRGLDMDIARGEVFGFLGHNGAGKTTTISSPAR